MTVAQLIDLLEDMPENFECVVEMCGETKPLHMIRNHGTECILGSSSELDDMDDGFISYGNV